MALVIPKIQKEMEAALTSAFQAQFASAANADPSSYQKQAAAIAKGVVTIMIKALQTEAEVLPGIGTPAGPTTSPGKIF